MLFMLGYYHYGVVLTYLSLVSSVVGIAMTLNGQHITLAIVCLMVSGCLDAFDGRVARTRKNATEEEKSFGIQIDSLCDMVCFGVLPACIGFACGLNHWYHVVILALFVLAALIRLGYYNVMELAQKNVDESGQRFFRGLPVTSIAIILPVVYGLMLYCKLFPWAESILSAMFLLVGFGYVSKLRIKKPTLAGNIVMIVFGACIMAAILVFRYVMLKR